MGPAVHEKPSTLEPTPDTIVRPLVRTQCKTPPTAEGDRPTPCAGVVRCVHTACAGMRIDARASASLSSRVFVPVGALRLSHRDVTHRSPSAAINTELPHDTWEVTNPSESYAKVPLVGRGATGGTPPAFCNFPVSFSSGSAGVHSVAGLWATRDPTTCRAGTQMTTTDAAQSAPPLPRDTDHSMRCGTLRTMTKRQPSPEPKSQQVPHGRGRHAQSQRANDHEITRARLRNCKKTVRKNVSIFALRRFP